MDDEFMGVAQMFDGNTFTDDCASAALVGTSMSLTSGQHDPNNFGGGESEATDQFDDSDRLLQSDITAEAQMCVITFPESEVSPCTAELPVASEPSTC